MPVNLQIPQQIEIDRMPRMALPGVRFAVERFNAGLAQENHDPLAADQLAFASQQIAQHTATREGTPLISLSEYMAPALWSTSASVASLPPMPIRSRLSPSLPLFHLCKETARQAIYSRSHLPGITGSICDW